MIVPASRIEPASYIEATSHIGAASQIEATSQRKEALDFEAVFQDDFGKAISYFEASS